MAAKNFARQSGAFRGSMPFNPELIKDRAFIGGNWVFANKNLSFSVYNPADGSEIAKVPDLGAEETSQAIDAAYKAFPDWAKCPPLQRSDILRRWAALIREYAEDLSRLMTYEQGKPLTESHGEIMGCAGTLDWCAEEGRRQYGEYIEGANAGTKIIISRYPIGVVGAITPWNFPASMITRKVGPALAAGCTVVLKPAEATPLCALALAYLAEKAGIPAGVLNIVTSSHASEIGKTLTSDPRVRKISFTGSTEVGRKLMGQASTHLQKVSLELGGNAPFIIFEGADLEKAAEGAVASKFRNAGQTCICANRIYVHTAIWDEFVKIFSNKIKLLRVGPGCEEHIDTGPLIDHKALEKVEKLVESAIQAGAEVMIGGKRHQRGGNYYEPTLITGVNDDHDIACEEIFGPVAVLYPFETEQEVIERANNTPYGLAAYIYSEDLGQVLRVSDALQYGMVGVNEPLLATDLAPFGGIKESGIGREGGRYGVLEYMEIKYRLIGKSPSRSL